MVEKLKQLKSQGEKVRFRGCVYVPPPRPDYRKLHGFNGDGKGTNLESYETDSDEFNTPEKQRQCDLPCEEIPSDSEEEIPEWAERMISHLDDYLENIPHDRGSLSSDSSFNVDN